MHCQQNMPTRLNANTMHIQIQPYPWNNVIIIHRSQEFYTINTLLYSFPRKIPHIRLSSVPYCLFLNHCAKGKYRISSTPSHQSTFCSTILLLVPYRLDDFFEHLYWFKCHCLQTSKHCTVCPGNIWSIKELLLRTLGEIKHNMVK